jgi:hypothetical protein
MMNENDNGYEEEGTPLDSIISRVDSYIKDPKLVTSETLEELKSELVDLKSYLDEGGEKSGEEPMKNMEGKDMGKPSIVIALGKMGGKR